MVYIVGIGPGSIDYIMPKAVCVMESCDFVIGFGRAIHSVDFVSSKRVKVNKISEVVDFLNDNKDKNIAVVASGDPLYYGITNYISSKYNGEIEVIPGISSFQYLMSKLKKSWQGAFLGSLHGREESFLDKVKDNKLSIWLTDKNNSPDKLCSILMDNNIDAKVYVGESLSYDDEKITICTAEDVSKKEFLKLCVMVVEIQ